jgi:hypothetical protein
MTVEVADPHAPVHRLISVVKIATLLEIVQPKSIVLLCVFLWARGHNAKIIIKKKYFLFTVGSVCRVKRFTTGSKKFFEGRSKLEDDA